MTTPSVSSATPGASPAKPGMTAGETGRSNPSADAAATAFTVLVRSAPAGASVIIDGKRVGTTPATIALRAPTSVLVSRSGYQPLRVKAERAGPILVRLVPLPRNRPLRPAAGETLD